MKKYIIALGGIAFLFMANREGRPIGVTGAPGETGQVCSTCHNGGSFNADIVISLANSAGDQVTEYIPGQEYDLTVTVSGSNAAGFGFQLVPLTSSNDKMAGDWGNLGNDVKLQDDLNRTYIVQSDINDDGVFTAKWIAPDSGSGSVDFYSSGIAANGNGGTTGDMAVMTSISIGEGTSTSVGELDFEVNLYPNPTSDFLIIEAESEVSYNVFSVTGESTISNKTIGHKHTVDISSLQDGTYMISLVDGDRTSSKWFVKQ